MPLLFWKKEMVPDSGGPGKFRGGLGQQILIEVRSREPIRVSLLTDRHNHPAQGFQGGGPGSPTKIILNDGQFIHPKSQTLLQPGDKLSIHYAGGGGFGPPRERGRSAVEEDVREERISRAEAEKTYGLGQEGV